MASEPVSTRKTVGIVAFGAGIAVSALPMALSELFNGDFGISGLYTVGGYAIYAAVAIAVIMIFKRIGLPNRWEITILSILTLHSLPVFGMLQSPAGLISFVAGLLAYPLVFLGYDYLYNHTRIDPTVKLIIGVVIIGVFYFGSNMLYGLFWNYAEY